VVFVGHIFPVLVFFTKKNLATPTDSTNEAVSLHSFGLQRTINN
jgi:hypothetical protein